MAPPKMRPRPAAKPRLPGRFDAFGTRRLRSEIDSRTAEMTIASIHGLRADIEALEQRLRDAGEREMNARIAAVERDLDLLRGYLDARGLRPTDATAPPEFTASAPTVVVGVEPTLAPEQPAPAHRLHAAQSARAVVTAARWGAPDVVPGEVSMVALVDGLSDGTPATFRVFLRGDADALGIVESSVHEGSVEATWRYGSVARALDWSVQNRFFFVVDVGDATAESDFLPGIAFDQWKTPSED
ncbi:MAG TPA: hypothetical protein VG389_18565 [Myxococcota bacterium]|nr:hypothetical protein [Myxococcota bacterium]